MASLGPKTAVELAPTMQLVVIDPIVPANSELDKVPLDAQTGMRLFEAIDKGLGGDGTGTGTWPGSGGDLPEDVATEAYVDEQFQIIIDAMNAMMTP